MYVYVAEKLKNQKKMCPPKRGVVVDGLIKIYIYIFF
jgi:hypothetical protein